MNLPMLAIIPSLVLFPPLALLGLLLPAIFGGWLSTLRRWRVLLLVATLDSTLYLVHFALREENKESWWARPATLWITLTLIALAGAIWAWRRWQAASAADPIFHPRPRVNEHV